MPNKIVTKTMPTTCIKQTHQEVQIDIKVCIPPCLVFEVSGMHTLISIWTDAKMLFHGPTKGSRPKKSFKMDLLD
jgi:hypothetical protein